MKMEIAQQNRLLIMAFLINAIYVSFQQFGIWTLTDQITNKQMNVTVQTQIAAVTKIACEKVHPLRG